MFNIISQSNIAVQYRFCVCFRCHRRDESAKKFLRVDVSLPSFCLSFFPPFFGLFLDRPRIAVYAVCPYVCPSVFPSVCPSVCPSVDLSLTAFLMPKWKISLRQISWESHTCPDLPQIIKYCKCALTMLINKYR